MWSNLNHHYDVYKTEQVPRFTSIIMCWSKLSRLLHRSIKFTWLFLHQFSWAICNAISPSIPLYCSPSLLIELIKSIQMFHDMLLPLLANNMEKLVRNADTVEYLFRNLISISYWQISLSQWFQSVTSGKHISHCWQINSYTVLMQTICIIVWGGTQNCTNFKMIILLVWNVLRCVSIFQPSSVWVNLSFLAKSQHVMFDFLPEVIFISAWLFILCFLLFWPWGLITVILLIITVKYFSAMGTVKLNINSLYLYWLFCFKVSSMWLLSRPYASAFHTSNYVDL